MTRVLVVHHDIDLADQETESLRRHGYDVQECMGPVGAHCPILADRCCSTAENADVLVYDAWVTGEPDGAQALIEGLRRHHPNVPIVLCAPGIEPEWMAHVGQHAVTPLVGPPTGVRLAAAIEEAIVLHRQRATK